MKRLVLTTIKIYQYVISPIFPPTCRFIPSCSQYAWDAVNKYGVLKGGLLALRRLSKCHPFHAGGVDPVK